MIHRLLLIALTLSVLATSAGIAQDPAEPGEPLRLKKKKKPDAPEKVEPKKDDAPKDTARKEDPKEPAKEPPIVDPVTAAENEKELLERIARNMRRVEDQLLNKELTEATVQIEDDILKDLDSLIKKTENDQNGGGGGGGGENNQEKQDGQDGQGNQEKQNMGQGGQGQSGGSMTRSGGSNRPKGKGTANRQKGQGTSGRQKTGPGQKQQAKNQPGSGSGGKQTPGQPGMNPGQTPNPNPMGPGNTPDPKTPPDRTADLYKDVWGHLPETVRAQMNAYAGKEEYMQKHRDLIKQYYRMLAEQGSKK